MKIKATKKVVCSKPSISLKERRDTLSRAKRARAARRILRLLYALLAALIATFLAAVAYACAGTTPI